MKFQCDDLFLVLGGISTAVLAGSICAVLVVLIIIMAITILVCKRKCIKSKEEHTGMYNSV